MPLFPTNQDPSSLPTIFSEYFTEKISTIRSAFPLSDISTTQNCSHFSGTHLEIFKPVTEKHVLQILRKTSPKTCELDPIPTKLLYENFDILLPSITAIINESLSSGIIPSQLKSAMVKPHLKKPSLDKNSLKNYRPVSNLPFLSKILEKVVLHQLLSHLQHNDLCNAYQSAYRAGHSTETTLLRVVNDLLKTMDNDDISVLLLLDLSAAFDTVDHHILLSRLENVFGIHSAALQWFRSYLLDRFQFVSVDNLRSATTPLLYGVPQGSVLGPVLFVLYTTPLSDTISAHPVNHHLYADDTQLQNTGQPSNIHTVTQELQACTDDIKTWMGNNQLKLNDDKTEAIMFSPPSLPSSCILPSHITVGSHVIPFAGKVRNLGFTLDAKLSMKQHVTKVCQAAFYELKRISSIRKYLTEDATKTLVTSCILSRLDYCNSLLMGSPQSVIEPLQKVQNSAARLILKASRRQPCTPLMKQLHWLPVSERIKYKTACLCFSCIIDLAPLQLSELVQTYIPSRALRSADDSRILKVPSYKRKTHGYRSFSCCGPALWNSLPYNVRHSATTASFKSSLKTHLFSQYYLDKRS